MHRLLRVALPYRRWCTYKHFARLRAFTSRLDAVQSPDNDNTKEESGKVAACIRSMNLERMRKRRRDPRTGRVLGQ